MLWLLESFYDQQFTCWTIEMHYKPSLFLLSWGWNKTKQNNATTRFSHVPGNLVGKKKEIAFRLKKNSSTKNQKAIPCCFPFLFFRLAGNKTDGKVREKWCILHTHPEKFFSSFMVGGWVAGRKVWRVVNNSLHVTWDLHPSETKGGEYQKFWVWAVRFSANETNSADWTALEWVGRCKGKWKVHGKC